MPTKSFIWMFRNIQTAATFYYSFPRKEINGKNNIEMVVDGFQATVTIHYEDDLDFQRRLMDVIESLIQHKQ